MKSHPSFAQVPEEAPLGEATLKALALEQAKRQRIVNWGINGARALFALAVLAGWELASGWLLDRAFFSRPSDIVQRLVELFSTGAAWIHINITLSELVTGYALGAILGVGLGFALGRSRFISEVFEPFIMAFYSIPKVALAPLFIIWLGIGILSKVAIVALMVFFLVFFNTYSGVRNIEEEMVNIARVMGGSRRQITRWVVLPAASPFIIMGLKTAVPFAVIGAVIGEFIASNRGLGFYILYSASTFDAAGLFAGIIILLALVFIVNTLLSWLQKRVLRWKPSVEAQVAV